jgi:Mlc titration factor MtfA (ptsG expression regulator)
MLPLLYGHKIEKTDNPVVYVIAGIMIVAVVIAFFRLVKSGYSLFRTEQVKDGDVTYDPERESAVRFHLSTFLYFRKLTAQGKTEFVQRTLNFMETHSVEGEDDYEPGLPAKIHVAAAATQLTFGLDDFAFTHFETILLYPGIFRMREGGPLMKGATTPNGVIRISIRDFNAGYENPSDKLNVGLHEFGHALFMEFLKAATEDDEELKNKIYSYLSVSDKMLNEGKHNDNFLRDYAFTNRHEFFAVSVEHFFEAPKEFKEKLPGLYALLKNLLKQDPAGELMDYGIVRQNKI